jgi:pilus assembly protein TadC
MSFGLKLTDEEKPVRIYPLAENELTTISVLNTVTTGLCSGGMLAAAAVIGCLWDMVNTQGNPSARSVFFLVVMIVLTAAFFFLAKMSYNKKNTEIEKIKSQCLFEDDVIPRQSTPDTPMSPPSQDD